MIKLFAICLAVLASFPLVAIGQEPVSKSLLQGADSIGLHTHEVWQKLLHYEEGVSGTESAIHSKDFFLSDSGKHDPRAELQATLLALSLPAKEPNKHAQCKFPARYLWLKNRLDFESHGIESINCPDFNEWSLSGSTESISIVFATGYLGNPASYYGHTLLKLNSRDQSKRTSLLDVSVNYGAIVPDGEGPIPYIFKGILGGYSGGFSHIEYYFHNHNYGENELRDLWEYRLDLPQHHVDLIVAHAWEVLGKEYTYYFFRRNCAYRMAELVEIVSGVDIIPDSPFFTIPQSLIKKMSSSSFEGKPLVSEVTFHPSRQSRLYQRYNLLSHDQKVELVDLVHEEKADTTDYGVLDTLIDYHQFARHSEEDLDSSNENYRRALAARYSLPPHPSSELSFSNNGPHDARPPSFVSFGLTLSGKGINGGLLRIRPAYYDPLDSDSAHIANSTLSMADIVLSVDDSDLKILSFDAINIESANTKQTSLPGDNEHAWSLRAGFQRQNLECTSCLVPRFEGTWGKAKPLTNRSTVTGTIGGGVQENKNQQGTVFAIVSSKVLYEASVSLRAQLEASYEIPVDEDRAGKLKANVNLRYKLSQEKDIRLSFSKNKAETLTMSFGTYW